MLFPVVAPRNDAASNTPADLPGTSIAPAVSLAPAASTDTDAPNTPGAPESIAVLLVPSELSAQSAPSSALAPSASFTLARCLSESPPAFRLPPRRPTRRLPSLPFQMRRVSLRRDELFLPHPPALFRCVPEPDAEVSVTVLLAAAAADVGAATVSSTFDVVVALVLSFLPFLSVSFKSFPLFRSCRSCRSLAEESGFADKSVPWM
jgi:hypothetical protein